MKRTRFDGWLAGICASRVFNGLWFLAWITLRRTAVPAPGRRKEQRFAAEVLGNRPAMLLIRGYTCHNRELQGM